MTDKTIISGPVGRDGANHLADVRAVQELINHHLPIPLQPLVVDGRCGSHTIRAIEEVERRYIHAERPDGRIDPHGPTLRALNAARPVRPHHALHHLPATVASLPGPPVPRPAPARPAAPTPPRSAAPSPAPVAATGPFTPGITPAAIAAAQAAQRRWNVPASITLAQYIQESSAGLHMPHNSNNPFGMKAGRGQPFVMARTREETADGRSVYIMAPFRQFASIAEAFDAHGHLLATGRAYALARQHADDPDAYADALTHHYATDSHYGRNLKGLMKRHQLYQYNVQ